MKRTWLIEYRNKKGYSQQQMAQEVKISQQYYSFIENSKRGLLPPLAKKIADVLGFYWGKFYE